MKAFTLWTYEAFRYGGTSPNGPSFWEGYSAWRAWEWIDRRNSNQAIKNTIEHLAKQKNERTNNRTPIKSSYRARNNH